jgi:hypothetical protein
MEGFYEIDVPANDVVHTFAFHYKGNLHLWQRKQLAKKDRAVGAKNKLSNDKEALLQLLVDQNMMSWTYQLIETTYEREVRDWAALNRHYHSWERSFAALLEYCKEHDTCNIPVKETFKCDLVGMAADGGVYHYEGRLGEWLNNQRRDKRASKLPADREAQLQALVVQGK